MRHIYAFLFIFFVLTGCQKEVITIEATTKATFADSAVHFLKASLTGADFDKLNLQTVRILRIRNEDAGIILSEKGMTGDNFILLHKTATGFNGHRVSIANVRTSKHHSGTILLETLDRKFIKNYIVKNNKVNSFQVSATSRAQDICIAAGPPVDPAFDRIAQKVDNCVLPEVVITAYRSAAPEDYLSLYWMSGGSSNYYNYYTSADGYGGGGEGGGYGGNAAEAAPEFYSPDTPVLDIKNEVKCFTGNSSATYTITVNVNQPVPGLREVYEPLSNFPVGHTFLTLRQVNPDGSEIIRNLGFYPKTSVKPGSTKDIPIFGEDSETPFDVSLRVSVSAGEFMTVIANMGIQQTMLYDLDNFNCTTSVIASLKSINIQLPETRSTNILFNGLNPADLGEDIKALNLDNFSANNGGRKVIRTVSSDNSQKAPAKTGGC